MTGIYQSYDMAFHMTDIYLSYHWIRHGVIWKVYTIASGNLAPADMLDIYGYLWICIDIHGYILASSGTYPTCCTGLDIHLGYPYISIDIQHIHQRYPIYPHFIFKNDIFALSMLLSIKVSIHIHFPLCISMCIQMRYPS
jgi:hypothetical protein